MTNRELQNLIKDVEKNAECVAKLIVILQIKQVINDKDLQFIFSEGMQSIFSDDNNDDSLEIE